jgi:FlaG/FlaF family flagellin (archaellin)
MKKLLKNKKGVSPVVSAVIMMLVVMIGMSALFAFFVNYARDFQLGSGSSVLESMAIEDVHFIDSKTVEIWIYNMGKVDFSISSVYVNDSLISTSPTLLSVTYKGEDVTSSWPDRIREGGHGQIRIESVDQIFTSGQSYTFKLVTKRGTSFEGEYKW